MYAGLAKGKNQRIKTACDSRSDHYFFSEAQNFLDTILPHLSMWMRKLWITHYLLWTNFPWKIWFIVHYSVLSKYIILKKNAPERKTLHLNKHTNGKFWIKPLKETDLGMVQAFFKRDHVKTQTIYIFL